MPLGVWIQFLEPSSFTRGVASSFSPGSRKFQLCSIVETAKEMVSIGMLLQTIVQGIPLYPLGMPQQTTGEMCLKMFNDAKAAISMGKMDGLYLYVYSLTSAISVHVLVAVFGY